MKAKFRQVMVQLLEKKTNLGEEVQQSLLLYAKAQWSAGEFSSKVRDSVKRASIRIDIGGDNIAGVMLPQMNIREIEDSENNFSQIGLDRGGQSIQMCRDKFKDLLQLVIQIASLQTSFVSLDQVIKVTNRRVNALEHIVIPRFLDTINYINQELDELEREDFTRLKKVLDNKKKMIEEAEKDKEKREQENIGEEKAPKGEEDIFNEKKDEDLLF